MSACQKLIVILGVFLLAALGSSVSARPCESPRQAPGKFSRHDGIAARAIEQLLDDDIAIERIGLSADQVTALKARLADAQKTLIKLRADVELAEAEIRKLMRQDPVDRAAVMQAIDAAGAAYVALRKAMIEERLAFREIAGPQVAKKVRRFLAQRRAWDEEGAGSRRDRGERRRPPVSEPD